MTGLWQVSARANATFREALEPLVRDIRVMQNSGDSVILETTDQQGAKLAFAADNAKLWFLLRPPVGAGGCAAAVPVARRRAGMRLP